MDELELTPVHRSLNRSFLVFGGERELSLMLLLFCVLLVATGLSLLSAGVGIAVWFGGISLLQMMARKDPIMVRIIFNFWKCYPQKIYMSGVAPGSPTYKSRNSGISR